MQKIFQKLLKVSSNQSIWMKWLVTLCTAVLFCAQK